jgi:hypothetical protein
VTRTAPPAPEPVHAGAIYAAPDEEADRDLDVPAFMRRPQF